MPEITLTLLTRTGCHLCDDMATVVREASAGISVDLKTLDVDSDPALRATYGDEVPVLLINGRRAFKYRVAAGKLRRRLYIEQRRRQFAARMRIKAR